MREARAEMKWQTYMQAPQISNLQQAAKKLVREFGDDEATMVNQQQAPQQMPQGMQQGMPQASPSEQPIQKALQGQTQNLITNQV